MFLSNSRYFNLPTMKRKARDGRTVTLVAPRLLPAPAGVETPLNANDRLDILALRQYQDGARFWHIADANTATEARLLTEPPDASSANPPVSAILVPEK
jgi:hypothetical protein